MTQGEVRAWTATIAEWAAGLRYEDLPAEVVHHAKRSILDHLAVAVAGADTAPARAVRSYLDDLGGAGPSTVWGAARPASPPDAALANGTAAHALEADDGYTPGSYHPGAPVLAAVLAVAEARGSSAEELLRATAIGYEVSCRLAGAGHPATWRRGFHNTAVVGVFGAAVGVAALLRADASQLASTLGLAGSHASGLFEFLSDGSDSKRLHAGKAARDGVVCAELAMRGLTGPRTVLEGSHGYVAAYVGDVFDEAHLLDGLGTDWRMRRTYLKPYPCCRHLHGPIDALLALRAHEGIDPDAVEQVDVETFTGAARHGLRRYETFLDAQMSIPYAVAVTLLHGEVGVAQFEEPARHDPRVARLVERVRVRASEECNGAYPRTRPAIVRVRVGGRERSWRIEQPLGEPDNPLSDADLEAKAHRLCDPVVGTERCKRLIDAAWALDDPGDLFGALRTEGTE